MMSKFSDVEGHWASGTIAWAVENNVVSGFPDGTFRPNDPVTEPEFLVMLLGAFPEITLSEGLQNKPWYERYYLLAEEYNWPILHDTKGSLFNRGHVAHLLAATQGNNLSLNDAVQYVLDAGIANGKTSATVSGFGIQDKLKRSEALTLIKNMYDLGLVLVEAQGKIIPAPPVSIASFTVRGISIGDSKQEVIDQLGLPARYDLSEYGFDWYIYNQDYAKYVQVGVQDGLVVGLYSNVDNWTTESGVRMGSPASVVKEKYGEELTFILKGYTKFLINVEQQDESPLYLIDGNYVTVFLDKHNNDSVAAIQIIDEKMELSLLDFHGVPSDKLRISFERQVFDLANSVRVRFGKKAFVWNDQIAATARKHSKDMADNDFFAHTNLSGQSLSDRLEEDGIKYLTAGENIAAGQSSAVFAHEGWMNSKGHRVNILGDFQRLGVGVHFGGSNETYYTQNFYTPY